MSQPKFDPNATFTVDELGLIADTDVKAMQDSQLADPTTAAARQELKFAARPAQEAPAPRPRRARHSDAMCTTP